MTLRLRQIALVAKDRDRVVEDLRAVLGLEVGHIDPGVGQFGLHNKILPVGHQFLEIVAPVREGTTAGRYLERRNGDGGYMVILQCSDHAPVKRRVAELGIRKVLEFDSGSYSCMQLHPRDTGGSFLEVDHQGGASEGDPWEPAGHHWHEAVRTERVSGIAAAEIQAADPEKLAARWGEILDSKPTPGPGGAPTLALDSATLRFVADSDGRGEGLGGIDVTAANPERVQAAARERGIPIRDGALLLGGLRVRLV